jgi:hypothetical protein
MKRIICIFWSLVFLNCSHSIQKEKEVEIVSITIDADHPGILKLSDFFTDISYVLLSDSFLVSTIEQTKIFDDKLFLLTNRSVLIFDINSGKALLNIRHTGGGPGEYISLYDVLYDKNENTVELLDMNEQKVLKYGLDGHFISEFKTSFYSFSFCKINRSDYLFYNNNMISDITNHKLIRYDAQSSKISAAYFPVNKHLASYFFVVDANNFGSAANPSFHFCPSDTVYGFTDDYEPYAKYVLNFGKHQTPSSFYKENYGDILDFSLKASRNSYIYMYSNFCENDCAAALSFRHNDNNYWALFDKKNQNTCTFEQWIDDGHTDTPINITYGNGPFAMDETYLYFFLQAEQLTDLMEKEKRNLHNNLPDILDEIYHSSGFSEQSNPIIVKCKFKKS